MIQVFGLEGAKFGEGSRAEPWWGGGGGAEVRSPPEASAI